MSQLNARNVVTALVAAACCCAALFAAQGNIFVLTLSRAS